MSITARYRLANTQTSTTTAMRSTHVMGRGFNVRFPAGRLGSDTHLEANRPDPPNGPQRAGAATGTEQAVRLPRLPIHQETK